MTTENEHTQQVTLCDVWGYGFLRVAVCVAWPAASSSLNALRRLPLFGPDNAPTSRMGERGKIGSRLFQAQIVWFVG
jgi:hypothetical protein